MQKEILLVVDVQNDFVTGCLSLQDSTCILPSIVKRIRDSKEKIWLTLDLHKENYFNTHEGKRLPILHCQENSHGQKLAPEILEALQGKTYELFTKSSFASLALMEALKKTYENEKIPPRFCVVGLCTDICVLSQAIFLRSFFPESDIIVPRSSCYPSVLEKQEEAFSILKSCHIDVIDA